MDTEKINQLKKIKRLEFIVYILVIYTLIFSNFVAIKIKSIEFKYNGLNAKLELTRGISYGN